MNHKSKNANSSKPRNQHETSSPLTVDAPIATLPPELTHEQRLERQRPLDLALPRSVSIVGCGGVGSWTALFLALAGVARLILWDHDNVERHNLNRLPLDPSTIGENKAIALKAAIARMVPTCDVIAVYRWTAEAAAELGYGSDSNDRNWLVACTDTHASRVACFEHAKTSGIDYIECSAEGEFGGCTGTPATFITPQETEPGYASVPVWVGPCISAAMMTCAHILHDTHPADSNFRLGWNGARRTMEAQFDIPAPATIAKTA